MGDSSSNALLYLSYLGIGGLWASSQYILIPYTVHVIALVSFILYAASHHSLVLREEQEKAKAGDNGAGIETMKKEDAMMFPFIGSAALFGLYMAFKYLDKEWVDFILGLYFCIAGTLAVTATVIPLYRCFSPKVMTETLAVKKSIKFENKIIVDYVIGPSLDIDMCLMDLVSFGTGVGISWYYFTTRFWVVNNILGIAFCLQGIEKMSLGSFKIAAILLVGLFFYDIFWVFGTDVMVTVAKSLDGPIKILFPRSLEINEDGKYDLALLGLGDIVIPGFFIAMMLRFDAHNAKVPAMPTNCHASFSKPYFNSCLIAYMIGLGTTLFIMIYFNHAQPALLYLVPACLLSTLLCALVRGEMKELFMYSEEEDEKEGDTTEISETKKEN